MKKTIQKKIVFLTVVLVCWFSFGQKKAVVLSGFAQGTTYHITYLDKKNRNFQTEIDTLLKQFDLSVSTYNKKSIISRINANEANVTVDSYFTACFVTAKTVWKNTEGAFDPTVYPLVNAWGFGPSKREKIEKNKIDSLLQFVGFDLIALKENKIVKKDPRVALDFNAFAQGYSVDVVSEFLNTKGVTSYIVEIGGEVYANGRDSKGKKWEIGIEQPYDNQTTQNNLKAIVTLENSAVSTSGNNRKFIRINGIKYAHHLDPRTGYPVRNNLLSASVFAKKCITTDANATGILVMGLEKAKLFLNAHPELQAYLIYSDDNGNNQVYQTPNLKSIIKEIKD